MTAELGSLGNLRKPLSPQGLQTVVTLANAGFTIYAAYAAAEYARTGELPDPRKVFDPRSLSWATVHIGGKEVTDITGKTQVAGGRSIPLLANRGLIRAIGKSMAALERLDPEAVAKAWEQFGYTRLTPAVQAGITNLTGTGFTRSGYFTHDLSVGDRVRSTAPVPLNIRQGVEAGMEKEGFPVEDALLAQAGITIYPGPSEERIKKKGVAQLIKQSGYDDAEREMWKTMDERELVPEGYGSYDDFEDDLVKRLLPKYADTPNPEQAARTIVQSLPIVKQYKGYVSEYKRALAEHDPQLMEALIAANRITPSAKQLEAATP
jgi:hypothetical protein